MIISLMFSGNYQTPEGIIREILQSETSRLEGFFLTVFLFESGGLASVISALEFFECIESLLDP